MNIVWFSWKDEGHPSAGGAEAVSGELRRRLAKDGHSVRLVTAQYKAGPEHETVDGVEIHRKGGRFSVYWHAYKYFKGHLQLWPDVVIDEMNTIPFGCAFYVKKRTILLAYQLARRVWFYQMVFPWSLMGYLLEPFYLFVLSRKYKEALTESESTKRDLARYGFRPENVEVFRVGLSLDPITKLGAKEKHHQVLSLGAVRPMKRTLHAVKGFEVARDSNPELRMVVAGDMSGAYASKVMGYIKASLYFRERTNK